MSDLKNFTKNTPTFVAPNWLHRTSKPFWASSNRFFGELAPGDLAIPPEIKEQLAGRTEWGGERIATFLKSKERIISQIMNLSQTFPPDALLIHLIKEPILEYSNLFNGYSLVRLAFLHEIREGSADNAARFFKVFSAMQESGSRSSLMGTLSAVTMQKAVQKNLIDLAKSGHDVSHFVEKLEEFEPAQLIANGIRAEAGIMISMIERSKEAGDQPAMKDYLGGLLAGLQGEGDFSLPDQLRMKKEAASWDPDDFQDDYARVISGLIEEITTAAPNELKSDLPTLSGFNSGLSIGKEMIMQPMIPQIDFITASLPKVIQSQAILKTWDALNRANAAGLNPATLSELVPRYLPKIPLDPLTNEALKFDASSRTLEISE